MRSPPLLPLLAIAALVSLLSSALLLILGRSTPQLAAHLAFAFGVLPLILAAMSYFVPVLTRSTGAGPAAWLPSLLALAGGVMAVSAFANDFSPIRLGIAASFSGFAAIGLGAWTLHRARQMFGPRHRGLDWYLAALGFLVLALLAVILLPLFPQHRSALRLFHLHANLLGFVGLTAIGTLQVLLPTCLGQGDPDAVLRLRRDLKWGIGGTLLIASGSFAVPALAPELGLAIALLGASLYGWVVLRMLGAWQSRFGLLLTQVHGAAPSLIAAALGMFGLLVLGGMHGAGWIRPRPAVLGFVIAFLLPLVSGAAAQLFPVWLRPGAQSDWHHGLRTRAGRWGGLRGFFLMLAGLAIALDPW